MGFNVYLTKFYKQIIKKEFVEKKIEVHNSTNEVLVSELELPIDSSPLNLYSIKQLKKIGIVTLRDFINISREKLDKINLPPRYISKIAEYRDAKDKEYQISFEKKIEVHNSTSEMSELELSIDSIPLNLYSIRQLKNLGIATLRDLINISKEKLIKINLPPRYISEIIKYRDAKDKKHQFSPDINISVDSQNLDKIINKMTAIYMSTEVLTDGDSNVIKEILLSDKENSNLGLFTKIFDSSDSLFKKYYVINSDFHKNIVKYSILLQCFCVNGCSYNLLLERLNKAFGVDDKFFEKCLKELQLIGDLIVNDDYYYETKIKTFGQILTDLLDDDKLKVTRRDIEIYRSRVNGLTLQNIGDSYGCTRERIRQIINRIELKCGKYFIGCEEYKYKGFVMRFNVDKKTLIQLFDLSLQETNFIFYKWKCGEENLIDGCTDIGLSISIKEKLIRFAKESFIIIGNLYIKKHRLDILKYVVETFCKDDTSLSAVYKIYMEIAQKYKLEDSNLSEHSFHAQIERIPNALSKQGHLIRFFDFSTINIDLLLEELHFNELDDVEISTHLFFLNYPDVLKKYDIRDKYELHNLLRKSSSRFMNKTVKFLRMPGIAIGNVNREDQVKSFFEKYSPISIERVALLYEKQYGVDPATFNANYLKYIKEDLTTDKEFTNSVPLGETYCKSLELVLDKNLYHIKVFKRIFKNVIGNEYQHYFNKYNFLKLGFIQKGELVYLLKDKNAKNAVRRYFLRADKIILDSDDEALLTSSTFTQALSKLKASYQIIEFCPCSYISSSALENFGINKDVILQYVEEILKIANKDYFSLSKISLKVHNHPIYDLGFETYFYESILKASHKLRYTTIENNVIFKETDECFYISDIIKEWVDRFDYLSISNLIDIFNERFEICLTQRYNLITASKRAGLYYDQIMDSIFRDKSKFYEEV